MLKQPGVCYKKAASKEYESQKIWIRRGLLGSKQAGIVCVCLPYIPQALSQELYSPSYWEYWLLADETQS